MHLCKNCVSTLQCALEENLERTTYLSSFILHIVTLISFVEHFCVLLHRVKDESMFMFEVFLCALKLPFFLKIKQE